MKIAIVGSRSFDNYQFLKKILDWYDIDVVVSGGAKGADRLAARYAVEKGIELKEFLPNWDLHGRAAGFIRNKDIVKYADEVIAFWDGKSKGTAHSIQIAEDSCKPVHKYWSEPDEFAQLGL